MHREDSDTATTPDPAGSVLTWRCRRMRSLFQGPVSAANDNPARGAARREAAGRDGGEISRHAWLLDALQELGTYARAEGLEQFERELRQASDALLRDLRRLAERSGRGGGRP